MIFARAVADLGGRLEAIVEVAQNPRDVLPVDSPSRVRPAARQRGGGGGQLSLAEPTSESYMAASKLMIDAADELYAVWDGQPSRGYGGTADVVAYARARGKPVRVIWPAVLSATSGRRRVPWASHGGSL